MKSFALLLALSIAATSLSAQAPQKPVLSRADSSIAGEYVLRFTTSQGGLPGTLVLKVESGALTGSIGLGDNANPITSVVRADTAYTIAAATQKTSASYQLKFFGDSLRGTFQVGETVWGSILGARKR